jgi:hypothetical protein
MEAYMAHRLSLLALLPDFYHSEITKKELERIIKKATKEEFPDGRVSSIDYNEHGLRITLNGGNVVDVDIDWNEIILV